MHLLHVCIYGMRCGGEFLIKCFIMQRVLHMHMECEGLLIIIVFFSNAQLIDLLHTSWLHSPLYNYITHTNLWTINIREIIIVYHSLIRMHTPCDLWMSSMIALIYLEYFVCLHRYSSINSWLCVFPINLSNH